MHPGIFCTQCQAYLGPTAAACSGCGRQRPLCERFTEPGQPFWRAALDSPPRGRPIVTDEAVIIPWGKRGGGGGVVSLSRATGEQQWQIETKNVVEGGMALAGDCLIFGTLGFAGGELRCCRLDGRQDWRAALSGGVWSSPLVEGVRVYVGTDDGKIQCFDLRTGELLPNWSYILPHGRNWLGMVAGALIAVAERGEIHALDPLRAAPLWHSPVRVEGKITSSPAIEKGVAYFGLEGGRVFALNLRDQSLRLLAQGYQSVVATPAWANECLYIGAHDHFLHVLEAGSGKELWSREFPHSISAAPFVGEGIVVVAVNGGEVHVLDAKTGEPVGKFEMGALVRLPSDPLLQEGVIYLGGDDGQFYALPWHLGNYGRAGQLEERRGRLFVAGEFYTTAAYFTSSLDERERLYRQAETCWVREPEWAARLWEGLVRECEAADAYCRAAELQRGRDASLAAEYYYRASRLCWRLDDRLADAERCAKEAAMLGRWPRLRLSPWNVPKMTQGQPGSCTIRLENIGYMDATDIYLNLGGSLLRPVDCKILTPLPKDSYFDITLEIVPTRANNNLRVQADYPIDPSRGRILQVIRDTQIEADAPPHKIKMGDIVGGVVRIIAKNGEPVEIEAGDQVMTSLDIILGEEDAQQQFPWPDYPAGWEIENRKIIAVHEPEKQFTVPAGHWAIFLADERAVEKVAPGRYLRRGFPALRPRPLDGYLPQWKAVLFSSASFRLAHRLGPFTSKEGVHVGVECGLTVQMNDSKPYEMWKNMLDDQAVLYTDQLATWLEQEVAGVLGDWVSKQSEEWLSPGFHKREEIMLALVEEMRQTCARNGLILQDPIWALNFIIPGRERWEATSEARYWLRKRAK